MPSVQLQRTRALGNHLAELESAKVHCLCLPVIAVLSAAIGTDSGKNHAVPWQGVVAQMPVAAEVGSGDERDELGSG